MKGGGSMRTLGYKHTRVACYTGYVAQAVVNNLLPLLFVTLQREFGLSLAQVTVLVSLNFAVQLVVDVLSAGVVDRVGYRAAALAAVYTGCGTEAMQELVGAD